MLKDMDKDKTEFVSVVSHELKTPLSIVKQLLMLLYDEDAGPLNDRQREVIVKMQHNVDRLKDMVDKLLEVSRIERGKLKLHYSLINLPELLGDSMDYFKTLAAEREIALSYHFPKKEIPIFVDAERIRQVMANLLNNAIKFTEKDGRIQVEAKVLEATIRVGVVDTGIGIARADIPKIFNKFTQVGVGREAGKKGIGLGLAIARELVERHGGEIWAESRLGKGSRFYFALPRFYTADLLTARLKESIRTFLRQKTPVYLINLRIVNYKKFRERIPVAPLKMAGDIQGIIDASFRESFGADDGKRRVFIADRPGGKYSLIFPAARQGQDSARAATQERVDGFCDLLTAKIKSYFVARKIEDVFIALGILSYPSHPPDEAPPSSPAHLNIKEIYIGAEMRRAKRIPYETGLEVISPRGTEACRSLDLSQVGVCFISPRPFKTGDRMTVKFCLMKKKRNVTVRGRVAWITLRERSTDYPAGQYKVGLEFSHLDAKEKSLLAQELGLYYE